MPGDLVYRHREDISRYWFFFRQEFPVHSVYAAFSAAGSISTVAELMPKDCSGQDGGKGVLPTGSSIPNPHGLTPC